MDLRELSLTASAMARHPWELARLKVAEFLLLQARNKQMHGAQILDLGCGDAFVVSQLAERFKSVRAVAIDSAFEPSHRGRLAETLSPRLQLYSSLEEAQAADATPASVVLLLDVLEHCEKDREVLRSLVESRAVASGALFLITVPAFQALFCQHDVFLGHFRRYRLGEVEEAVGQSGLRVLGSSYFFFSLLLPRALQCLAERFGYQPKAVKGLGGYRAKPGFDFIVRTVLWWDFRISYFLSRLGIKLPGLSCFVLAEKK